MPMPFFWLIAVIVLVIVEAATLGLTVIWFAVGSLFALVAAAFGGELWLQITLFILASGISVALIRPFFKKHLHVGREKTNADRIVGMHGVVTETINNELACGLIRVNGQIWSARTENDEILEPGTDVEILSISGVKTLVRPSERAKTLAHTTEA